MPMKLLWIRGWFTWPRLACLVVTGVILWLVFRQIELNALLTALRQTRIIWVVLGFVAYGLAIWLASLRWHLALRLMDRAIHLSASNRMFLIGHFFYVVLFGAAGGDLAKSIVYARFYQFRVPEVLAAAPLDRVLGTGGNIVLAVIVVALALWNRGFANIETLHLSRPGLWSLAGVVALVLAVGGIVFWRPKGESFVAQTVRALRFGARRLFLTPNVAAPGVLFAFLSITALSSVFALSLRAVSQTPLFWPKLLWTFPVITLISSLPLTFAGAGLREAAALAFLGFYGVPPGECVAASLLTLVLKLAWGLIGAGVLWREQSLRGGRSPQPLPQTISVVIPTHNHTEVLPETVRRARANAEVFEVIVVDGGSTDGSREMAKRIGCRVFTSAPGWGEQMRSGAQQASGDVVLLLPADAWLPPGAGRAALNCLRDETVVAGGFWRVSKSSPLLLLGSRAKCALHLLLGRYIPGEQGIFVRRQTFDQIGGVPGKPVMEDVELGRQLRKVGRLALAEATVITDGGKPGKPDQSGLHRKGPSVDRRFGQPAVAHEFQKI